VVEIFTKNFSYEAMVRYLKTGLLDIEKQHIDILENFIIATGIKGKAKMDGARFMAGKNRILL